MALPQRQHETRIERQPAQIDEPSGDLIGERDDELLVVLGIDVDRHPQRSVDGHIGDRKSVV